MVSSSSILLSPVLKVCGVFSERVCIFWEAIKDNSNSISCFGAFLMLIMHGTGDFVTYFMVLGWSIDILQLSRHNSI